MVLGYFGKTPRPPDPEVVKLAAEQMGLQPTTRDAREINDEDPTKGREAASAALRDAGLPLTEENVFIAASLKEKGIAFLQGDRNISVRKIKKEAPPVAAPTANATYSVSVGGRSFEVRFDGDKAVVNGRTLDVSVATGGTAATAAPVSAGTPVKSEMPGKVLKHLVSVGDVVKSGQPLLKVEALKMEMDVASPQDGTVTALPVAVGQQVPAGTTLVVLG